MTPEQYWAGVPARFRDRERYLVQREVRIQWPGSGESPGSIKVYEIATDALVWAKDDHGR